MCSSCHSTNIKKGYNFETDTYETHYNEINVSCESCHGAGGLHKEYIEGGNYLKGEKINGSIIQLSKKSSQQSEVNICGNCHGRRSEITGNSLPGELYLDDFIPELPTTDYFYADG
jgi:Zn finger protein HypA/HybF involved in hydrogenase expression